MSYQHPSDAEAELLSAPLVVDPADIYRYDPLSPAPSLLALPVPPLGHVHVNYIETHNHGRRRRFVKDCDAPAKAAHPWYSRILGLRTRARINTQSPEAGQHALTDLRSVPT